MTRTDDVKNDKRSVNVPLHNSVRAYDIQLSIGNPAQTVTLSLDTGSSDIWSYAPGSCSTCKGGTYNPTLSSSATSANEVGPFYIKYFDESVEQGVYVRDDIHIAGTTVKSAVIAVATSGSDVSSGVFGIGFDQLEASAVDGSPQLYNGFLDDLVSQGIIKAHAYSLYLDDLGSSSGSLLLGGTDSSKYKGNLVTLPIVQSSDGLARLSVAWTGISITGPQETTRTYTTSNFAYPVVLDTGYTLTVLPVDLFNAFVQYFGAYQADKGVWGVNCNLGSGHINFGFGNAVTIAVPFSEIALPAQSFGGNAGACLFGFQPSLNTDGGVISFGDTFLRSAYVVYNYDTLTISLAQASYDTSCTNCAKSI